MLDGRIIPFRLRFVKPVLLAGELHYERTGLLIRLRDQDGAEGWGEASPLPGFSRDTLAMAESDLLHVLASPDWSNRPLPDGLSAAARFGLQLGLLNLEASRRGTSPAGLLSPQARSVQTLNAVLFPGEWPDDALAAGYRAVKLKVGSGPPTEDADRVKDLSDRLAGRAILRLDANRAWSLKQALAFTRAVDGVPIEYIEEPLADPRGLPELAARGLPVALDESLLDLIDTDLPPWIAAAILKPSLLGGLDRTRRMAQAALAVGALPVVSSSLESGLGLHGLLALAAGLGEEDVPAGLQTGRLFSSDVVEPRFVAQPRMEMAPGAPRVVIPPAGRPAAGSGPIGQIS